MKLETPAATIKDFFGANSTVKIVHHWRADQISGASREALLAPRTVRCVGRRYVFQTTLGPSEMDARNVASAMVAGKSLHLVFAGNPAPTPHLTYQAV